MYHATALVQYVEAGNEALQAAHLVYVAVREAVVGAHWHAALDRPPALQLLVVGAEQVLALAMTDDSDFCGHARRWIRVDTNWRIKGQ